jgi:hypothetical protein
MHQEFVFFLVNLADRNWRTQKTNLQPLWPKVERPSFYTNQIARSQEFGLSTLHTRLQSPKAVALQNAYMAVLFYQGDGLSKEVWVGQE